MKLLSNVLLAVAGWVSLVPLNEGLLYPRESPSREIKEINGFWHFRADDSDNRNAGFDKKWYQQPLSKTGDTLLMPVPSSYNDITQDSDLRDFIGWVWYDRQVWVPTSWLDGKKRIMLRFESAHYNTIVWVNGQQVCNHSGGHLPFEGDVTDLVMADTSNTITVAVNNTLTPHTIPPGTISYVDGKMVQNLQMDFFNYAGIQRAVKLYTTPKDIHLDDITLVTSLLEGGAAKVDYTLSASGGSNLTFQVALQGRQGELVAFGTLKTPHCNTKSGGLCVTSNQGSLTVKDAKLWWPWDMSDDPAYLYTFTVNVSSDGGVVDMYRQPVGIRTVKVTGTQFLINEKPFYFHGFGKHEDANIRGKGLDYPLMMKDINLLLWLGANSFRTSHYPYAEELMDLCDKYGIVVIDEAPAVGLTHSDNFADETLQHHLEVMGELVSRDKNRPSVVMWSIANEPASNLKEAESYFKAVADKTRSLDPTRPLTFACNQGSSSDLATQFMDVVAFNRYNSWYDHPGILSSINSSLSSEIEGWYAAHKKPVMITEYGAGAIPGVHKDPPVMYSEEYQAAVFSTTFPVFDVYRKNYFVGEMVWNFADFETAQSPSRAEGNKKGVLTRERQPKLGAWIIRERYHSLAANKKQQFCSRHGRSQTFNFCTAADTVRQC